MRRPIGASTSAGALYFHGRRDGRGVLERVQDVEPILARNKALASHDEGYSPSRELRRAASIPLVVAEKWRNELGIDVLDPDHWPAVKRLLNDPEWRWLRTAGGRL